MKRKIFNYFQIAASLAKKKNNLDKRCFLLGAVGIRNDGAMISAINGSSEYPNRHAHAKKKALSMMDFYATIYVVRVRVGNGTLAMARPCKSCMKALKSKKIKRIYYSISNNEYGVIDFKYSSSIKMKERIKNLSRTFK
jgi:tRNA(Arg) A34 adenosine deaminase TadA